MSTIRNVFKRKGRAFLTIFGIVIGVFTLVVMGAMAEKITLLVDGGSKWYSDKVVVSAKGSESSPVGSPLSVDMINEIEKVEGVKMSSAGIIMLLDEEMDSVQMGMPDMIAGTDFRGSNLESFKTVMAEGRKLKKGETGKIQVGSDIAQKKNVEVGDIMNIHGEKFEIIGIVEKTLTAPDTTVTMSLGDAQRLFHKTLPDVVQSQVNAEDLTTGFTVFLEKGYEPDKVADKIEDKFDNLTAMGPKKFEEQVSSQLKIFTSIIFGIAIISLLVGGLSVINTMTMSVSERTREIGIRKAIGASDGNIIRQFIAESATIGLIGGIAGLAIGWVVALALNAAGNQSGTVLFLVTFRLAIGSIIFALFLGVISGLYPAWRAARLDPVKALRYE